METIVDILGLAVKTDIVLTDGVLTKMLDESKIDEIKIEVSKTKVDKIGEITMDVLITEEVRIVEVIVSMTNDTNSVAEGVCSSEDEVEITYVIDTLSSVGAKSDWTFELSTIVIIKLVEAISKLDAADGLVGE